MKRNISSHTTALVAALVLLCAIPAGAQQQISALMAGMAANAKQLKQYTFHQRTETYYKNDLKNAKLDEVHYNAGGERISIPIDEHKAQSEPRRRIGPGSRLIAKQIENKQEEMKEYIERLMALASRYLAFDPVKLQNALATAEITTGGASRQVRIVMRNCAKNGDSMTMVFDSATRRAIRTEINTTLDDGAVSIVLAFDQLHDGPSYPGKTVITSSEKQLEVRVFTYDYRM